MYHKTQTQNIHCDPIKLVTSDDLDSPRDHKLRRVLRIPDTIHAGSSAFSTCARLRRPTKPAMIDNKNTSFDLTFDVITGLQIKLSTVFKKLMLAAIKYLPFSDYELVQ